MKNPLLLLHGALGAADQFAPLRAVLPAPLAIHAPDLPGHGPAADTDIYSIPAFAEAVLAYLDREGLAQVDVFGYSMGGYIALWLARHHPGRIGRIITLASKLHWDEATAAKEIRMLDPEQMLLKVPKLAAALEARHAGKDWTAVVRRTAAMMTAMGRDNPLKPEDYAAIGIPVLLLLGDRDRMVSVEETLSAYRSLPDGRMGMLPGTPHPLEQADPRLLAFFTEHFA